MFTITLDDRGLNFQGLKGRAKTLGKIALRSGGMVVANRAKEIITEKGLIKTGTMKRSIHAEPVETKSGDMFVLIGTNIQDPPYPHYLEFGTKRMSPKPFLRPALDETKGEALKEVGEALKRLF